MRLRDNPELEKILQDSIVEEYSIAHHDEEFPYELTECVIFPVEVKYVEQFQDLFHREYSDCEIDLPTSLKELAVATRALVEFILGIVECILVIRSGFYQGYEAVNLLICCNYEMWNGSEIVRVRETQEYIDFISLAELYKVGLAKLSTTTAFMLDVMRDGTDLLISESGDTVFSYNI